MQNAKENQTELINHSGIMNSMIFLKKLVKQKKLYSRCIGPEKTEYHRIFKQKRSVFDKKLRKIKNLFMKHRN